MPSGQLTTALAISPDNQTLALASSSGELDLIPLGSGPGGRYGEPLASNYDDQSNIGSGEPDHTGVAALAYSPDGTTLTAVNGDSTVRVWNLKPATAIAAVCAATGQSLTLATWQKYVSNAAFSPPCPADATAGGTGQPPLTASSAQGATAGICTAADLSLAISPAEPQSYTRQLVFTNVGHAACSVPGTPVVNLIGPRDAAGSTFSLVPAGEGQEEQPNPKNPVTLPPGGKAHMGSVFLGFLPGQPLPTQTPASGYIYNWVPQQVQVVLPGSHATLTVPWASGMSVLQEHEPHNPGNYCTPLMPGSAPSSTATAGPEAIAVASAHVWVANANGNSVTELNADNGSLARVLIASDYYFDVPSAITVDGAQVWVANGAGNSMTELPTG